MQLGFRLTEDESGFYFRYQVNGDYRTWGIDKVLVGGDEEKAHKKFQKYINNRYRIKGKVIAEK